MKIGISTWSLNYLDYKNIYEAIDYAKKYQFDCLDFTLDAYLKIFDWVKADQETILTHFTKVKDYADKVGISFSQTHAPYAIFPSFLSEEYMEITKKAILITSLVGAPYMVMHPLVFPVYNKKALDEEEKNYNIEFFNKLLPYLNKYKVKVAIENIYDWEKGNIRFTNVSHPKGLLSYLELLPEDKFSICLDTGHLHMAGYRQSEAIELWKNKLKVLHIHDNHGILDDHMIPFTAKIDWMDFKDALQRINFDGCLSLEIKPFKYLQYAPSGLNFIRELTEQLI